jgi:2-polyprenyl-3-methyl-5-hydroxy-6-metoxy-1,4-benzoquinol methylase
LRLLDIGCNVGTLVEEASMDGFDAWGVDLDPGAIEAGRLRGRNVWLGEATLDELPSGFDVIVLNHVLEHVIDLPTFVPPVAARLVSGGLLFVNVPNFAGLVPRLMGANWGALWPDQHAWQFEPDTLVRTVESLAPLACVARETSTNLEPPSRGLKGSVKRAVLALSCRLRVGDELRVVFRRH